MASCITMRQIWEDYKKVRDLKVGTIEGYEKSFRRINDWMDIDIKDITEDMIEQKHLELSESSPSNANLVMKTVRAMMNYAKIKYGLKKNPVKRLSELRQWNRIRPRKTSLKQSLIRTFWEASGDVNSTVQTDYLRMLILTGLRRSEAAGLQWKDVDFKERTFTCLDTKNHEDHTLPMGKYLTWMMEKRFQDRKNNWVFYGRKPDRPISPYYHAYLSKQRSYGIDLKLHDLRRTFNTIAVTLDIHPFIIKALMNHAPASVTEAYYCSEPELLRKPMQRIENYILRKAHVDSVEY